MSVSSPYPALEVVSITKVFADGHHNAFTDLCRFRDRFYLTFRSCPDGHGVFATSRVVILASNDGKRWSETFTFSVPGRDVRDPHFLLFKDRIYLYTGTWLVPPPGSPGNLNDHLGYGAWTCDGISWNGPVPLEGTYGHYVWRAASWRDKAYLCARRRKDFAPMRQGESDPQLIQAAVLESLDGLVWMFKAFFAGSYGDETAFLFESDGSITALVRGSSGRPARVCRSPPPYISWERKDLDRNVGGPLLVKWGDMYLVGGRKTLDPRKPRTSLYWLVDDSLHEAVELPSGGDNSYPGFVALDDSQALVSYYSSHDSPGNSSAIFMAKIALR